MRKLGGVPQIWLMYMLGGSMRLTMPYLLGVDRLSGYPSDTCVYMYRRRNKAMVEFGQEFEVL